MELLKSILWHYKGWLFYRHNCRFARSLKPIRKVQFKDLKIRAIHTDDLPAVLALHKQLREGKEMGYWRKRLYQRYGERLLFVVEKQKGELIAFSMYYFKPELNYPDDVHLAYIGMLKGFRGQKLGQFMHIQAFEHFKGSGLKTISLGIFSYNTPSLGAVSAIGAKVIRSEGEYCHLVVDLSKHLLEVAGDSSSQSSKLKNLRHKR